MKPVVVFGSGEIAQLAHYFFTHDARYPVAAFTVDAAYLTSASFCDLPVVAFEEIEHRYPPAQYDMFVAVSYAKVNSLRADKFHAARNKGYSLVSYVSSRATTWPDL